MSKSNGEWCPVLCNMRTRNVSHTKKGKTVSQYQFQVYKRPWYFFGAKAWVTAITTADFHAGVEASKKLL